MRIFIALVAAECTTVTVGGVLWARTDIPAWAYAVAAYVSSRMPSPVPGRHRDGG